MKFPSKQGVRRKDLELPNGSCNSKHLKEGEFCYYSPFGCEICIVYRPPGCEHQWSAPVTTERSKANKKGKEGHYWWWNGDKDNPTLEPSLGVPWPPPFEWHGWLKNGRFEAAE